MNGAAGVPVSRTSRATSSSATMTGTVEATSATFTVASKATIDGTLLGDAGTITFGGVLTGAGGASIDMGSGLLPGCAVDVDFFVIELV